MNKDKIYLAEFVETAPGGNSTSQRLINWHENKCANGRYCKEIQVLRMILARLLSSFLVTDEQRNIQVYQKDTHNLAISSNCKTTINMYSLWHIREVKHHF